MVFPIQYPHAALSPFPLRLITIKKGWVTSHPQCLKNHGTTGFWLQRNHARASASRLAPLHDSRQVLCSVRIRSGGKPQPGWVSGKANFLVGQEEWVNDLQEGRRPHSDMPRVAPPRGLTTPQGEKNAMFAAGHDWGGCGAVLRQGPARGMHFRAAGVQRWCVAVVLMPLSRALALTSCCLGDASFTPLLVARGKNNYGCHSFKYIIPEGETVPDKSWEAWSSLAHACPLCGEGKSTSFWEHKNRTANAAFSRIDLLL